LVFSSLVCRGRGQLGDDRRLFVVGRRWVEWFGDSRDKYLSRLFFSQHRIPHPQGLLYNIKIMILRFMLLGLPPDS
jgi:hypothetical protein